MKNLNNRRIYNWMFITVFSIGWMACETTQDTFDEFTKDGETIYVGTADTVLVGAGFNKLRFWVAINADPKIEKGILKTNDESVMHEFVVERTKNGNDTVSFDLELPEGEYTFGLFLLDANGNQSVRREVPATVYGENYRSSLINRGLLGIDLHPAAAVFDWADPAANTVKTVLSYEDNEGIMQTVEVPNEESQTVVENYKLGGRILVESSFKPTPKAIEEFEATPSENSFPDEYLLDKSLISPLRLPGDATDGCYGSSYARLTDGSTDEFWHSCEDPEENAVDLYPWVMSFDLGESAQISRFKLDERSGCCGGRSPGAYQIWATNDINHAATADIDEGGLSDWEADALAKGWVKLLDVSGNEDPTFEVDIPNDNQYKYLRIVGISSIDGDLTANFNEFTFWGK